MATLAETETYEAGVYQLEITDPVIGGPDGIDNLQAKQLANRTNWLKAKMDSVLGMSFIHTAVAENPGDTDEFGYWDSFTQTLRKVTLANFIATLKTYFDTVYAVRASPIFSGSISVKDAMYKNTHITVTSWSYVTTTITLNVASHTFVAGDYIEVGGLTATTNIPNGVHLVTSVTATTIVFTYALTPTGTAGVSSATVKGYMTTNGRVEGIGVGQTVQNVTGSRLVNTTYTNSTGNTIYLSIQLQDTADQAIVVGDIDMCKTDLSGTSAGHFISLIAPVPNGFKYRLRASGFTYWAELRL